MNYTDILKWIREILLCRYAFLLKHKEYANIGGHVGICKQTYVKLEVSIIFLHIYFYIKTFFFKDCIFNVSLEH